MLKAWKANRRDTKRTKARRAKLYKSPRKTLFLRQSRRDRATPGLRGKRKA